MGDLFGDWVPDLWALYVFAMCVRAPQHKYFFLTKNPKRYSKLLKRWDSDSTAPGNWYFGTSIENQKAADERIRDLLRVKGKLFISIEPLLEKIRFDLSIDDYFCPICREFFNIPSGYISPCCRAVCTDDPPEVANGHEWLTCPECGKRFETFEELMVCPNGHAGGEGHAGDGLDHVNSADSDSLTEAVLGKLDWIIIGAQTRPDVKPKRKWVDKIIEDAADAGIPVHCKDNLWRYWPDLPQERER
jgi:hypothetical protein